MEERPGKPAGNIGFGIIGAEAITMSIGSLLSFGWGRRFSICLFAVAVSIGFSIGQRLRADDFQMPPDPQAPKR